MPNFRRSHGSEGRRKTSYIGKSIKLILLTGVLIFLTVYFLKQNPFETEEKVSSAVFNQEDITGIDYIEPQNRFYLPSSTSNQIVHHKYYSLSYNEKYEIADWVAYVLTKQSLKIPNVERAKRFKKDIKIRTRSAIYYDYSGSGYSRGHLAPAGDMAFNEEAMEESFYLSNITPQKREFNGGIWNELEQNIRNWAWKNNKLFIATGPIIDNSIKEYIGKNKVGVPGYFYKVVMDIDDPERKAIGFIIPNELSTKPLQDYAVTVDSVENITGIDFFKDLLTDEEEEKLESKIDISKWKISEKIYKKRIEVWNKQ